MVRVPYITVVVIVRQVLGLAGVVCGGITPNESPHMHPLRVTRKRRGSVVMKVIMKDLPGLGSGIWPVAIESAYLLACFRPRWSYPVSM